MPSTNKLDNVQRLRLVECHNDDDWWADMKPTSNGEFVRFEDVEKALVGDSDLGGGLTHNGKPVSMHIAPGKAGGMLVFRCGLRKRRIPLAQILSNVVEPKPTGLTDEDLVNLEEIERRASIMVINAPDDVSEKARYSAKVALLALIRELRDERREEAGLPPVDWRGNQEAWDKENE